MSLTSDTRDLRVLIGRFLLPYWMQVVLLVVLSFIAATLNSTYPLLLAPLMDIGAVGQQQPATSIADLTLNNLGATLLSFYSTEQGPKTIWQIMIVIVSMFMIAGVLAALIEFSAHMLSNWITTKAHQDLQVALHGRLLQQELGFFLRSRVGELTTRFITDAGEAMTAMDFAVRHATQAALQVTIYGWLLFKTSPTLACATLLVSFAHMGVTHLIGGRLRASTAKKMDSLGGVSSMLQEGLTGIRIVKSFGAEQHERQRFAVVADVVREATLRFSIYKNGETPLRRIADTVAIGLMLLLAFSALQANLLTFSGFVLFIVVVRMTIAPISAFAQALTRLQGGLGSGQRVLELLAREPLLRDGNRGNPTFNSSIRLEDVNFSYLDGSPILKEINLEVRKGEFLAIVGASGSGKSTIADLVLRLYDPNQGRVTLDGVDVREFLQVEYRRLFGVVSQESLLFNESIRDNIVFGRSIGSEADLKRAIEIANAAEFIDALPEGLETLVGDRGVLLSGGQRQRIAIARAIYARPPILILDEATSALDSRSERLVQEAIDRVLNEATAIVIAHRLSTVLHANRIVLLDEGRIEGVGTHAELIAKNSAYKRLCQMQFGEAVPQSQNDRGVENRCT